MKKFELCPIDTGAIVLEEANLLNWREAKKYFKSKGYKGRYLLLGYDADRNIAVHRVNIK